MEVTRGTNSGGGDYGDKLTSNAIQQQLMTSAGMTTVDDIGRHDDDPMIRKSNHKWPEISVYCKTFDRSVNYGCLLSLLFRAGCSSAV